MIIFFRSVIGTEVDLPHHLHLDLNQTPTQEVKKTDDLN